LISILKDLDWKTADKGLLLLVLVFAVSLPLLTPRIYSSDEIEYYSYLRSLYKDGDLDFTNDYEMFVSRNPKEYKKSGFTHTFLDLTTTTGLKNNFAPVGCSILWLPWFFMADVYVHGANLLGAEIPDDGFSAPYIKLVVYGSMFYGFLGILIIYSFLRRLYGATSSLLSTALVWFATPVVYYMYVQAPMSHSCSLFIVSAFIWYWHKTLGRSDILRWALLGLMLGLAGLVREQNLFFVVILFAEAAELLRQKINKESNTSLKAIITGLATAGVVSSAVFSIQLIIYSILYGRFSPSPLVARKMHWDSPFSWGVLFNYSHGLFFWTPVIFFAVIGLILFSLRERFVGLTLMLAFLTQVYISGAVGSWHASGSFGHRRFINCSLIFAVGLGYLAVQMLRKKIKIIPYFLASLFILWNMQLIVQFAVKIMDRSQIDIGKAAYNAVTVVPERMWDITKTFFTSRGDLVKQKHGLKTSGKD